MTDQLRNHVKNLEETDALIDHCRQALAFLQVVREKQARALTTAYQNYQVGDDAERRRLIASLEALLGKSGGETS